MIFTPRPWQVPMIQHMLENKRCNVWADMGSGKTSAVLSVLEVLQMAGSGLFPVLVIAPLRVARDVWPPEGDRWDHLRGMKIVSLIGSADERRRALKVKADVYTINYENIPWLVEQCGDKWPFLTVVADESTRLKGFRLRKGTKRAHALAQVARKTQRWVNLTGTPSPNGLKDLWGQAWFLDYGQRLGSTWTAFKDRWFDQSEYTMEMTPKLHAEAEIIEKLKDITLTIQMKDWVDLKAPIVNNVYVNMGTAALKQYKKLEKEMFLQISQDVELTALTAAAKSTKCLQFAAGACYHGENSEQWVEVHDEKLNALESIIEETAGANIVVFYWWKHDRERILKRFKHARCLVSAKDEADWNAGKIPLLLAHPQSAGHGLNLQHGGHHMVYFSNWWNTEATLQSLERLGPVRQMQSGYDRPVFVYNIITRNTLDEDVVDRHNSKVSVQESLMKAMRRTQ